MRVRDRDERGAVAIIYGVAALLMLGLAAMGVDLGNAMNRQKRVQTSADFAALAGANGLPSTATSTVQLVADYLNKNQPASDGTGPCNQSSGPITVGQLQDGNITNGEVTFPKANQIKVTAPSSKVTFGLANAIGFSDTCVNGTATAAISSSAVGMAPFYTTSGCALGPQIIKDDSGVTVIPPSAAPSTIYAYNASPAFNKTLASINPTSTPMIAAGPTSGPSLTVTMSGNANAANGIDAIGFFRSDGSVQVVLNPTISGRTASVNIPNAVASVADTWWVRVGASQGPNPTAATIKWSPGNEALGLTVVDPGAGNLADSSCAAGPASGNFGGFDLPRGAGNTQADLSANIALGLKPPITLAAFPPPLPGSNTCNTDPNGVISTAAAPKADTNCVQTITGLKAKAVYDGYLKSGYGKLLVDTSPACSGRPNRGPNNENEDLLTCFLKDGLTTLAQTLTYSGSDALFTQDIWRSPRLIQVPVFQADPNGSKWMAIKGFAVGFITDQPVIATKLIPFGTVDNGITVDNPQKLRQIQVFLFSPDALPPPPDGLTAMQYFGAGKKVITLVN